MQPALSALLLSLVPQESVTLLDRVRAAIGRWDGPPPVLEGRGDADDSGAKGTLLWACSADGAFRMEVASKLPSLAVSDGREVWTRDHTGLGREVWFEEADRLRLFSWVLSSHWLDAPEVEVRPAPDGGALVLHLAGTPLEMTLELDASSGLPAALVERGESGSARWTFSEFSPVSGRRLAHAWAHAEEGIEDRYRLASYAPAAAEPARFAHGATAPTDVRFDPDAEAEIDVVRTASGHLLVEPLLEGESLGAFVFDTGAGITVIDAKVADELLLETLGHTVAVGVAGSTTTAYRRGESFQLGPVTIENPIYGDLDLGFLQAAFGRRIAGIVGYDLIARCVVEIETATPRIALHDPAHDILEGGGWQELRLHQNHACVSARFEGDREGLFRIDTGAGGTVTFHAPAVTALHLLEGRTLSAGQSGGVGGAASAPEGELAWFELGGHRFEHPRVAFSQAESGAFTDPYTTGNLGQKFLEPFRIVLDYPHARLALRPRR